MSAAARAGPGRTPNTPASVRCEKTCSAEAAAGRFPAASSTPSSIMSRAPPRPSSPGWNMKITLPGRSRWRAESTRAAPTSIAVCRSWPQACIAPSIRDANGRPVASVTGSASLSARSSTTGPGRPPRSTAVTELSCLPRLISSGSPSRAARILACVFGSWTPISGSRWIACRNCAISPAIAVASSNSVIADLPLTPTQPPTTAPGSDPCPPPVSVRDLDAISGPEQRRVELLGGPGLVELGGPAPLPRGGRARGDDEPRGPGPLTVEVARVHGGAPDDLVDPPQLRDRELGRAERGRQRRVLELRAGAFHAVGQDALMVERQHVAVEDVARRHPAGVGGAASCSRLPHPL